jgi:O-antigen ligase
VVGEGNPDTRAVGSALAVSSMTVRPSVRARVSSRQYLVGSLAVALLLFGTRWASHAGAGPVFVADVLLATAAVNVAVSWWLLRPRLQGSLLPLFGVFALAAWAALRFAMQPELTMDAIRDLAPYAYATVALLAGLALAWSRPEDRRLTATLFFAALGAHAVWVLGVRFLPLSALRLPEVAPGVAVFSTRSDVDTALVGVLAACLLLAFFKGGRWANRALAGYAACWSAVVVSGSRAGFLGAALCSLFVLCGPLWSRATSSPRRMALIALSPLVAATLVLALPSTSIGQRLLSTLPFIDYGGAPSSSALEGQGTANARAASWSRLVEYNVGDSSRNLFGVGFGPDYMADSGAIVLLVGKDPQSTTRAAHSFWLGTWSRVGIVGLVSFSVVVWAALRNAWRLRRRAASDPLLLVASLVVVGLLAPFSFGVVLEAPFGAIPFFYFAGLLLVYPSLRTQPPSLPARGRRGEGRVIRN